MTSKQKEYYGKGKIQSKPWNFIQSVGKWLHALHFVLSSSLDIYIYIYISITCLPTLQPIISPSKPRDPILTAAEPVPLRLDRIASDHGNHSSIISSLFFFIFFFRFSFSRTHQSSCLKIPGKPSFSFETSFWKLGS